MRGNLPGEFHKLKKEDKATFHSPSEELVVPAASTVKPEERKFAVDSGASMHMVSKKDLNGSRVGDPEGIEKSDGGNDSQRRSASKRRGNIVRP